MPVVYFTFDQTRLVRGREYASERAARAFADWVIKKGGHSTLRLQDKSAFERHDVCPECGQPTVSEDFGTVGGGYIRVASCIACKRYCSYPAQYDARGRLRNHIQKNEL